MDGQVKGCEKKRRVVKMKEVVKKATTKFLSSQVGQVLEVLFEREEQSNLFVGHSKNYCLVKVESKAYLCGRIERVKIEKSFETFCFGKIFKS